MHRPLLDQIAGAFARSKLTQTEFLVELRRVGLDLAPSELSRKLRGKTPMRPAECDLFALALGKRIVLKRAA